MSRLIEKGAFISKQEAVMLQAVAVMLMVWHHLFGFPERVSVPYVLVLDAVFHVETLMSYFGRICIAVFAFCSGYGMEKKSMASPDTGWKGIAGNYLFSFRHLVKFYSRYWWVFSVFIPLGFVLNRYSVNAGELIKAFLGFSYVYNAEWWYIGRYVIIMALFPVLSALLQWLDENAPHCSIQLWL